MAPKNKKNSSISNFEKRTVNLIYPFIYLIMAASFLIALYPQIKGHVFEEDLLWFVPAVARQTEGLSILKLINYFFASLPTWYASPALKIYTFAALRLFGPLAQYFIFISIMVHFLCSALLFLLCRNLGLNSRISFLSALMYLVLFAHFHAYMWPMAFQHLIVVFFILAGLVLYLKTIKRINQGRNYRPFFIAAIAVNLVASFCSFSILILPLIILTHILFCARGNKERIRQYDMWLPVFIIYTIWPLFALAAGECRIFSVLRPIIPLVTGNGAYRIFVNHFGIPARAMFLFLLLLPCFFIFRFLLIAFQKYDRKKALMWPLLLSAMAGIVLLISIGGLKRLLIPYNLMVPFVGILASFLQQINENKLNPNAGCDPHDVNTV